MSSSLLWQAVKPDKRESLPYGLKKALQKRFGSPVHVVVGNSTVPYLEGLVDADVEGAAALIELIAKYGEIQLDEDFG